MSTPNTPRPAGGTGGTRPAPPRQAPVGAQRPAGAPRPGTAPKPSAAQRPAGAPRPGAPRPGAPRPAGAAQGRPQQLVRPAPKAKVRKARLLISKIDPWSVLKMAFLLSVALGIVTVVASVVLWSVLDLTGIFEAVNGLLREIIGSETGFDLMEIASLGQVASFATIIAVVNVVLLTALSMLSAVLYNLSSTLVGGIGVTLTDD